MTNKQRNAAITAKIERYTQYHTATPDLAQEAIERRITMNNGKDSAVPIMKIQSPETSKELFRINIDGTVEGEIENASEAAKAFFESFRDLIQRNIRQPAQSDEEGPCLKCNAAGDDCGEHAPSWEELSVYWKAEAERLRQPTQSDALAPIGTEGKYVFENFELSCRVTEHIEGWLGVKFKWYNSPAVIRPSRFIPLQEQSK